MKAKLKSENLLIYTETLVDTTDTEFESLNPRGEFAKKILIISDNFSADSEEQVLLSKMLHATGLTMADIYHLQLEKARPLNRIISKLRPENIISFGGYLNTTSTSFTKRLYKPSKVNDIQILMTHGLHKIKDDNELKQALWNGLKKMFNL